MKHLVLFYVCFFSIFFFLLLQADNLARLSSMEFTYAQCIEKNSVSWAMIYKVNFIGNWFPCPTSNSNYEGERARVKSRAGACGFSNGFALYNYIRCMIHSGFLSRSLAYETSKIR